MTNGAMLLLGCGVTGLLGVWLLPNNTLVARFKPAKPVVRLLDDRRVISSLTGALIGALSTLIVKQPAALLLLCVVGAVIGYVIGQRRHRRADLLLEQATLAELPVVIEMLALAIAAGEAPAMAIDRVSAEGSGPLMRALRGVVSDIALGRTLIQSLSQLRHQLPYREIDRFVDGITLGHERGTPLTDILHAQALDARERQRRALIEKAGSTEVAMMIPVVFLIMPITILFALFPSFYRMTWA
jgi:tight adherence protein C